MDVKFIMTFTSSLHTRMLYAFEHIVILSCGIPLAETFDMCVTNYKYRPPNICS